jgi:methylthioribose-1-phosphate isomerase
VGVGDLIDPPRDRDPPGPPRAVGDLRDLQVVGAALARAGFVRGSEGNLSWWDGRTLRITRTGARLDLLGPADVVEGGLDDPPPGASSDLQVHVRLHRERGPGGVVHAHPPGSVPEGWREGEPHGIYAHAPTLEQAFAALADAAGRLPPGGTAEPPIRPLALALSERREERGRALERALELSILDQRRLPREVIHLPCRTAGEVAEAIRSLAVRGAPAIGIAAAYGLAVEAARVGASPGRLDALEAAGRTLAAARPTAVNLGWAVGRVLARARACGPDDDLPAAVLDEARRIEREDALACSAMARLGAELVPAGARVLTICNTGMLCTGGIGTAQGVIYRAHLEGKGVRVLACETRPVWQGARLTAWELGRLGVPFELIPDAAAASLMRAGEVDLVVVGADRIAASGDVANKIGTYGLAVLARHHGIPLYVVAPTSTIDPATPSGERIVVEERDPAEVTAPLGVPVAPPGTPARNPAFDVTPAELVAAIVTEAGVARPPFAGPLGALGGERRSA